MKFIFETITDCVSFQIRRRPVRRKASRTAPRSSTTSRSGSPSRRTRLPSRSIRADCSTTASADVPDLSGAGRRGQRQRHYDNSRDIFEKNDWHADTSAITGPTVTTSSPRRWLARFCVKVDREGPRQAMIPGYIAWKNRLAYAGDPLQDYVCVQMDSVEITQGAYKHRFASFYHESEPGFDDGHADLSNWQEILRTASGRPARGSRTSSRPSGSTERVRRAGSVRDEILPTMRLQAGQEYDVEWPCVLYIDRFNRGSEYYIAPVLDSRVWSTTSTTRWTEAPTGTRPSSVRSAAPTSTRRLGQQRHDHRADARYRMILFSLGPSVSPPASRATGDPRPVAEHHRLRLGRHASRAHHGRRRGRPAMADTETPYGNPGFLNNVLGRPTRASIVRSTTIRPTASTWSRLRERSSRPRRRGLALRQRLSEPVQLQCPRHSVRCVEHRGEPAVLELPGHGDAPYVNYAQVVRTRSRPRSRTGRRGGRLQLPPPLRARLLGRGLLCRQRGRGEGLGGRVWSGARLVAVGRLPVRQVALSVLGCRRGRRW